MIYGEVWLLALIVKAINEVCGVLNATISVDFKTLMAEMLINDKWYLRVDEILLVLARGAKGHYGVSNKNLNQEVIYSWFEKHERERDETIEADHIIKKNSAGNNADRNSGTSSIDNTIRETIEKRIDAYKNRKPWSDKTNQDEYGIMNDLLK